MVNLQEVYEKSFNDELEKIAESAAGRFIRKSLGLSRRAQKRVRVHDANASMGIDATDSGLKNWYKNYDNDVPKAAKYRKLVRKNRTEFKKPDWGNKSGQAGPVKGKYLALQKEKIIAAERLAKKTKAKEEFRKRIKESGTMGRLIGSPRPNRVKAFPDVDKRYKPSRREMREMRKMDY